MPRRPKRETPENLLSDIQNLLQNFKKELSSDHLREKVIALVPVFYKLRDLGSSLAPEKYAASARERILCYFRKYPYIIIKGDELMVISGIQEYARRVRELRVQFGWAIVSGVTAKEAVAENEWPLDGVDVSQMSTDDYILINTDEDRDAAYRWNMANEIRRKDLGVKNKLLEFFRRNVGQAVTNEELRYVAGNRTEWARRVRELRTEEGWPIVTRNTGRPDLSVGTYLLELDRQGPQHDRGIPDPVRGRVLMRDEHKCRNCGWNHALWNASDPRFLELHHIKHHKAGGDNSEDNLITLCNICHDEVHRKK